MAASYKILAQLNPSSSSLTTLYNTPVSTQTIISTLNICNQDNLARSARVAIVKSGQNGYQGSGTGVDRKSYIVYDTTVPAFDSLSLTLGITLGPSDNVLVFANGTTTMSFNAFGTEIA
jgi:hypothetical protein